MEGLGVLVNEGTDMSKPKFEFMANSTAPDDESGVAVWRYVDERRTGYAEVVVRQEFPTFRAAHAIDGLISTAFNSGEACGFERCSRQVLAALKPAVTPNVGIEGLAVRQVPLE